MASSRAEHPGLARRRQHRDQLGLELLERANRLSDADRRPLAERSRAGRTEDMQVTACQPARVACAGSMAGGGTIQTVGSRAPSHRIASLPVKAA